MAVRFRVGHGWREFGREVVRRGGRTGAHCRIYCSRFKNDVISNGASGKPKRQNQSNTKKGYTTIRKEERA